ncbi:hypothetical protein F01_490170 [Burkholderia cenocepacia]|nr:hypothetical protein F01_490170 [Burkholderia cenocepacia]
MVHDAGRNLPAGVRAVARAHGRLAVACAVAARVDRAVRGRRGVLAAGRVAAARTRIDGEARARERRRRVAGALLALCEALGTARLSGLFRDADRLLPDGGQADVSPWPSRGVAAYAGKQAIDRFMILAITIRSAKHGFE